MSEAVASQYGQPSPYLQELIRRYLCQSMPSIPFQTVQPRASPLAQATTEQVAERITRARAWLRR